MGKIRIVLAGVVFLALTGCAAVENAPAVSTESVLPNARIETQPPANPTVVSPTGTAAPAPTREDACPAPYDDSETPRDQYGIEAFLDVSTHTVQIAETIVYTNRADIPLTELLLVVEPNREEGIFRLADVMVGGADYENFSLNQHKMTLLLPLALPPGCSVVLKFGYSLALPEQAELFGYLEDQIVLTNWYPFVAPYHPEWGWLLNAPGNYGEHLVYPYTDYQVRLTLSSWENDPQIAAPVQPERDGESVVYRVEGARAFSLAVLYGFKQVSQTTKGVTYTVYYQTVTEQTAQTALETMENAVHLYSQMFGPYPFDSLTMTELEMFDGMEFDAQFFLSKRWFHTYDGTPKNNLVLLSAHETAHNWWFSQVGNDQAFDPWLDEALCVYSELLYLEAYHPELVGWWWDFRIYNFEPAGPINISIYDFAQYENYRQAVYLRGAEFIQAVRDALGDGQFFTFLQDYLAAGQGKVMSTEDFFSLLAAFDADAAATLRAEFFGDW